MAHVQGRAHHDIEIRVNGVLITSIEVKTDRLAHRTGNAAIELESSPGRPGWFWTCDADWLVYIVPDGTDATMHIVRWPEFRLWLGRNMGQFTKRRARSGALVLLVPLAVLAAHAHSVTRRPLPDHLRAHQQGGLQ